MLLRLHQPQAPLAPQAPPAPQVGSIGKVGRRSHAEHFIKTPLWMTPGSLTIHLCMDTPLRTARPPAGVKRYAHKGAAGHQSSFGQASMDLLMKWPPRKNPRADPPRTHARTQLPYRLTIPKRPPRMQRAASTGQLESRWRFRAISHVVHAAHSKFQWA